MEEKNNIEISIVVPVYNVEKYLKKCIESILEQTFKNFELILVDDGSLDNSSNICDYYKQYDSRVKVIHKKNGGLSSARNIGIEMSKGKYITFVDSDDYIDKYYCEHMMMIDQYIDVDIIICDYKRFNEEDTYKSDQYRGYNEINFEVMDGKSVCKELYLDKSTKFTIACGKLYKKELFSRYRYPENRIHEDEFITYKLLYYSKKIINLNECLYYYRVNPNSITLQKFTIKKYDAIDAMVERIDFFKKNNEEELVDLSQKRKSILICEYYIRARKEKVTHMIPKRYKSSLIKSIRVLKKQLDRNDFEWFMYQYYPRITVIYIYLKRIVKGSDKVD